MDFCRSYKDLVLVKLRLTHDYACIDRTTREIKFQGSKENCKQYFDTYCKAN